MEYVSWMRNCGLDLTYVPMSDRWLFLLVSSPRPWTSARLPSRASGLRKAPMARGWLSSEGVDKMVAAYDVVLGTIGPSRYRRRLARWA